MRQLSGRELLALAARTVADGSRPLLLLDVREPFELALASIRVAGTTALDIPMNQIPAQLDELDLSQPVACICHHGARSAQVVAFLERQGMTEIYNLAGGIDAWSLEVDPGVPRY